MSSRELARVLIRVLGVSLLAYGVMGAGAMLTFLVAGPNMMGAGVHASSPLLFPLLIAIFLIVKGDWIADRFRIGDEGPPGASSALGPTDLFRVGCALIGVYCLTRIAAPLATIAAGSVSSRGWIVSERGYGTEPALMEAAVNLIAALILLFGPGRMGRWTRRASPPPDATPPARL